jgi:hypothetical protein
MWRGDKLYFIRRYLRSWCGGVKRDGGEHCGWRGWGRGWGVYCLISICNSNEWNSYFFWWCWGFWNFRFRCNRFWWRRRWCKSVNRWLGWFGGKWGLYGRQWGGGRQWVFYCSD